MASDLRTPQRSQPSARARLQWRARTGARPRKQSIARSRRLVVGGHEESQTNSATIRDRVSAADSRGRTIFVADAHRGDGKRFVVHAEEKLTAFLELERAIGINTPRLSEITRIKRQEAY